MSAGGATALEPIARSIAVESQPRSEPVRRFRIIPRFETYPVVLAFAQTLAGKLTIIALFAIGLATFMKEWTIIVCVLIFVSLFPNLRRWIILAANMFLLLAYPFWHQPVPYQYFDPFQT